MIKSHKKGKTKFCNIFGYSPESKILEYLLEAREIKFTFNDVIIAVGLGRNRAYEILKNLLKKGYIEKSEKVKHIQFYKANSKNEEFKLLAKLFDKIISKK